MIQKFAVLTVLCLLCIFGASVCLVVVWSGFTYVQSARLEFALIPVTLPAALLGLSLVVLSVAAAVWILRIVLVESVQSLRFRWVFGFWPRKPHCVMRPTLTSFAYEEEKRKLEATTKQWLVNVHEAEETLKDRAESLAQLLVIDVSSKSGRQLTSEQFEELVSRRTQTVSAFRSRLSKDVRQFETAHNLLQWFGLAPTGCVPGVCGGHKKHLRNHDHLFGYVE